MIETYMNSDPYNRTNRSERGCHWQHAVIAVRTSTASVHRIPSIPRSTRRRGSVLVLVMTLLSILFVIGVAFLATISFEQDIIQAERLRFQSQNGVDEVFHDFTGLLRKGLMAGAEAPFGGEPPESSVTGFAQLPMWHNTTSPIDPYQRSIDDAVVFNWYTDVKALQKEPFDGPHLTVLRQFELDTQWPNGTEIPAALLCDGGDYVGRKCNKDSDCPGATCVEVNVKQCVGGANDGDFCDSYLDCQSRLCQGQILVDADGDGIVDTLSADTSALNFSRSQLKQLSTTVNGQPDGRVSVGLRTIPHNGLVNLNESHPNLIQNVLGLAWWPLQEDQPTSALNNFVHTPTKYGIAYNTYIEEPLLRRRGGSLPPQNIPPSKLFGADYPDPASAGGTLGDMQNQLLPFGEYPDSNSHRYWMFRPDETITNKIGDPLLWSMRMEPFYSSSNNAGTDALSEYDRRHLVTTISYDDLLSRGGSVMTPSGNKEINQAMREANHTEWGGDECVDLLPFEYANYPHSMDNDNNCCLADVTCKLRRLKGRLQLSLSWLDGFFTTDVLTNYPEAKNIRNRLIYDAFWMLVRNAAGFYWNHQDWHPSNNNDCNVDAHCGPGPYVCDNPTGSGGICIDPMTRQPRREALISRTAASLTANLIDYVDNQKQCNSGPQNGTFCTFNSECPSGACEDLPTRVAVRAFDFTDLETAGDDVAVGNGACRDGIDAGKTCRRNSDCRGSFCDITSTCIAGPNLGVSCRIDRDCGSPGGLCNLKRYVYGLERQPFISEVATDSNGTNIIARGIEIFNPYDKVLEGDYWIYEIDPTIPGAVPNKIKINQPLEPANNAGPNKGPFTTFVTGSFPAATLPTGTVYVLTPPQELTFKNGWIIYLVRQVEYEPGVKTEIVVDQFHVNGATIGREPITPPPPPGSNVYSMFRSVPDPNPLRIPPNNPSDIWKVSVPTSGEVKNSPALGNWNPNDPSIHPVELNPSNAGLYAQLTNDPTTDAPIPVAFPTTGSMLLLLRHANRSWYDYQPHAPIGTTGKTRETELAFTTWLDDVTVVRDMTTGATITTIKESELIDNGRMPLFDRYLSVNVGGQDLRLAAHHEMNDDTDLNKPGGVENLPWGQLVFDYFTTLSLNQGGPYTTYGNENSPVGLPHARPRVDLDGLRVHGRIDINAAPLLVLQGLPLIPMERIPQAYQARFASTLRISDPTIAEIINFGIASAIVAYREAREGNQAAGGAVTGDYGLANTRGRAWLDNVPAFRRGTGFLTVGELANVRIETSRTCNGGANHGGFCQTDAACSGGSCDADNALHRIDLGKVNANAFAANTDDADFVEAIALLASLGDWITVRSDVYTMYGVIRGEIDPSIDVDDPDQPTQRQVEDLEARSIRFQHTVDRLMTFFGEPAPVGIGDRSMGKYRDVNNN